jgi:hypothetical protein
MNSGQSRVRLKLALEQAEQLAPLTAEAARDGQNALFTATVVPYWKPEEVSIVWEFQVVRVQAKAGGKIARLIRENSVGLVADT